MIRERAAPADGSSMEASNLTELDPQTVLKVSDAAAMVGTSPQALRLRISRGTLQAYRVPNARGTLVSGLRVSDLLDAYPNAVPHGAARATPVKPVPHQVPHAVPQKQPAIEPTKGPEATPTKLTEKLERTKIQLATERETSARALAVIQDRQLAPVFDQLRQDVRSARRESRLFAAMAVAVVGGIAWFAVSKVERASSATVFAQEQTIQAMGATQDAQAQALQEAAQRAQVESQAEALRGQLGAAQEGRASAEAKLQAIALGNRIRAGVEKSLRIFR